MGDERDSAYDLEDEDDDEGAAPHPTALDPRTAKHRLLACARCHAPAASSAWSGRVVVRCASCSFEEERVLDLDSPRPELMIRSAPDAPYRGAAPDAPATSPEVTSALSIDLGEPVAGYEVMRLAPDVVQRVVARRLAAPDDRALEWECVWVGIWLAMQHAANAEPLAARVALETTLEATSTPAYRALVLAHLAQHAAAANAPTLAKRWLRACPRVDYLAVQSEVRAARAFLALIKGRLPRAQRLTGDARSGAGYLGFATLLARAVNVEAHDRANEHRLADQIMNDLRRKKLLHEHAIAVMVFKVGEGSLDRLARRVARRSTLWTASFAALPFALQAHLAGVTTALLVAGAAAVVLSCVVDRITLGWKKSGITRAGKAARWALCTGAEIACVLVPLLVVTRS